MHSLAFHISSSLSERAHYRQNLALTLSQPALLCSVFTLAQNVSALKASVPPSSCWDGEGGSKREKEGRRRKMEESGEKKVNVVTLKGQRESVREEGGVDGTEARKREGKLFVRVREEASQHDWESCIFHWLYEALWVFIYQPQYHLQPSLYPTSYSRMNHHVIHSVISDLWLGIHYFCLHL